MLHCYNCGNDLPDNMIYCTRCGKRLDAPETPTQVMGGTAAAVTERFEPGVATTPVIAKKKGGGLKALIITLVSLFAIGTVAVVAAIVFFSINKRSGVTVNSNVNVGVNRTPSNVAEVNVNAVSSNANAMIDNAMKQIQKAANDALAAANINSNVAVRPVKTLDGSTTRIAFGRGAVSATAAGTVKEEATFVLYARAGQRLTAHVTSPGGCVKFEDEDTSLTLETETGDNYLTVVNSCDKPTSMVLSVSIK